MENRYALFHVVLVLNILILVVSFTGVVSTPVMPIRSITEVMKNDTNLCETSKFLYDLEYTKSCASLPYPSSASLTFTEKTLDIFLCLGVYDTAYKICQYSSQFPNQTPFFNATVLTQYVEKYIPNVPKYPTPVDVIQQEKEFCDNLQGYTSSYDKINLLLKPLVENLNQSHKCQKTCFDLNDKIEPLCAVFTWIKKFDEKVNRKETKHDFVTSDKAHTSQLSETPNNDKIITEAKKISEAKESNEQNTNKFIANSPNDNVAEANVPENMPTAHTESGAEKLKSDTENLSKAKKLNNELLETQTPKLLSPILEENKKNIDIEAKTKKISKSQSMNNPADDVPKKEIVNEKENEFNKEDNTDDLRPSTLSENTQDNSEEDTALGIDDAIQPTRNQNGNIKSLSSEIFEHKDLQYPNIRTEDDSHFFTYFTVVTVACIAGYLGYHNKQKILAIVLEGRRSRNNRGRRRPSTANYRKLDCTLEEAVTSQCNANVTHVIY